MLAKKLLYFSYLSFFFAPYLLADSIIENQSEVSTSQTLDSRNYDSRVLGPKTDESNKSDILFEKDIADDRINNSLVEFKKINETNNKINLQSEVNDSLKNNEKEIEWKLIEGESFSPKDIKWFPIDINDYPTHEKIINYSEKSKIKLLNEKLFDFKLLNIGSAVPTPETLGEGDIRFNIGQVSPTSSGYAKGTGNQNYLGEINYGFKDNFLLSIFYTDADDPLHKRIAKLDTQPENRWSSYGGIFKWKFIEESKYKVSIEGSLENWMVQSGGCAGYKCSFNTSNIFNSETSMVENNNLVGSISIPIGLKYLTNYDFIISPKFSFLPESQSNQYGKGDFYGNNYGIGFGISYKALNRLKTYSSYYLPIGDSRNSFDDQLNFSKTSIYSLGANYSIDSRTNFQAFLSNGFGLSPATSVLSIPSSDELLYGFNIIYTPYNIDNYYIIKNEKSNFGKFYRGLSVSNNSLINSEDSQLNFSYDVNGSWQSKYEKALSQRFIVDITSGVLDKEIDTNSEFKSYFAPGNTILRGGAKAILYDNENVFTSSIRGSFGRVLAESKPGYFFGESINTYNFNEKISLNINPKLGVSGSGESSGLGTGLHWKVLNKITLISETNIPINNAENNITFGIRYSPLTSNKHIDLYSSNAFSFIDMGQLMKRDENILGLNAGILF